MAVAASAGIGSADAQMPPPTPFAVVPTAPKTFPIIGGAPVPDNAPYLLLAIVANDTVGVHALLAANTSPDESDEYGRTALIYAVMFDNVPVGQMLVGDGANPNIRDKLGKTALHWAAERGNSDMLRLLLDAKATVDAQNLQGLTPLMIAASNGKAEAVRLLLQYHADPRINDYTGHDAVDWAVKHPAIAQALKVAAAR
ncbi:MAG TPA: ankyrin repeat domain-containing protein [Stellaceae bacterium]|nr:ankyrin repeat domain-containing protein [Stellaceae bacterium]